MNICFYSGVRTAQDFELYPWYKTDVEILQQLGFSVHASKRTFDISWGSDAYFAWWPTSGFMPMLVAKGRRKPFFLVAGGDDVVTAFPDFGYWARPAVVRKMIRSTVRQADHIIAVSEHAAEQTRALGASNVSVVYNAIDVERYCPGEKSEMRDFVCIAARLSPYYLRRKPIATLIRALPQVLVRAPHARLIVIGKADEGTTQLHELADRLRVTHAVVFLGSVSDDEKLRLLQSAFAYVQPTMHEAFGVAIAEAMSCGLPVITSPVAAVPEVVGDCGLFADPHDHDAFAGHMLRLLENPQLAADLGQRARDRIVTRFTLDQRRKGFERICSSIPDFSV
jgi:glycosyltransferase involved in cell wall biosynthesis